MKHLITKLLLVMAVVFSVSVAQAADDYFNCNIIGNANFMDTKIPQSNGDESSWTLPAAYQKCLLSGGDLYFWTTGKFKLSQASENESNMGIWTSSAFQITATSINWGNNSISDLGATSDSPKFVHLAIRPNGGNFVKVKDEPFEGHEGEWGSVSSYFENGEVIYYHPNAGFKQESARFRAIFNDGTIVSCTPVENDPVYYSFIVPKDGLTTVKIERGKSDGSEWWGNYTQEMKSSNKNDNNCIYMATTVDEWGKAASSWTVYEPIIGPVVYEYYFRSNKSGDWKNDFQIIPVENNGQRTCTFKLSDLAGKEFGIQVAVNGTQRYWYIPASTIEAATTKSYSLRTGEYGDNGHFPSDAQGEYSFVLEFNGDMPSQLRVNPPSGPSYNHTLFVGISSTKRHQIQYENGSYKTYKFYVNEEDLKEDEFGFRFYSEPNGGVWMGNDTFGKVYGTDLSYDTKYTTTGIKRYFIKETGAYAINVESYDPEKNKVEFSLSKLDDAEIVLEPLYIGGTWNNGLSDGVKKTRITSSKGKYEPLEITVGANCNFRFYSDEYNGNWMGTLYTNNLHVDAEGTMPYTTVGTNRVFTLVEAGTYTINVSEYLSSDNKVTFTVTKKVEAAEPPATLYIRNSKDWNDYGKYIKMEYVAAADNDRNFGTFSAKVNCDANEDFAFHFVQNNVAEWGDRGIVCYPGGSGNTSVSSNTPVKINNVNSVSADPESAWSYKAAKAGEVTVMVHFKKNGNATVEVLAPESDKNYYFIGDMNNWFSNEFDGNLGEKDNNGETIAKGINATRWNANKDKWKFEYAGDGWYCFTGFPNQLLSGHFQIISGGTWDINQNDIFSHMVCVEEDDIKDNKMSGYRAFKMNRITREEIIGEKEYRVRKRNADNKGGSNLGTQCNAVETAELWFNPGNDTEAPRIKIKGTPKDYFIFYNMEAKADNPDKKVSLEGETNSEYWVRAAINSGKPNTNNYFLAGIKYGDYTLPFYDINGNTGAHMNVGEGIDLAPYDLKNMSERELNNLFFDNQDIVKSILSEDRLPNGRDISVYDQVWIAKVPSGFENPAGTKYNMTFNKAMTEADRISTRTLTTRHYYFFPQEEGLHVHINTDEITGLTNVASVDVAYRLYKTDNNYNTITIHHGEGTRTTEQLHAVGSVLPLTAESASKDKGWNVCEKLSKSNWGDPTVPGYRDDEWYVSWIPATETVPAHRREVAYDDNSAFVQFRMTIHLKQPINAAPGRRNEPISSYTVYVPERVDVANDEHHFSFNNQDLYVKTKAGEGSDGVWTGLREVLDEINGNVDPSSVETVYYNLQGVRVDNPTEGGVYIRVRGDKSDKVLF